MDLTVMNKKIERKLMVFENKLLIKIFGPTNDNGEWRIQYDKDIRNLYRDNDIVAHVTARRLRGERP